MTSGTRRPGSTASTAPRLVHSEAAERFKAELRAYLAVQTERLLVVVGRTLGEASVKLNDIAEGRSPGFARFALYTGRNVVQGKSLLRSVVGACATRAKEHVTGALKGPGKEGDENAYDDDTAYESDDRNDDQYDNENDDRNAYDDEYAEDGSRR